MENSTHGSRNRECSFLTLLEKKRDGKELQKEEIEFVVKSIAERTAQSEQIGAMLMAIYLRGLTRAELTNLTGAMIRSGDVLSWPAEWRDLLVDKHSTGGVGDKTSLILAPALAACGLKVPMISGRGLGHTGGTLDKLESIAGFRVSLSGEEFTRILSTVGCCIAGQTSRIVPADAVMYAARHITATVPSLPLVTSSIISKKAAENVAVLVLDVKYGRAAFMRTKDEARELGNIMVSLSNDLGTKTAAALNGMDHPLGRSIGNSLEVAEALECLKGRGPSSLSSLVAKLGAILLKLTGRARSIEEGAEIIRTTLSDGSALRKFTDMIRAQGVEDELATRLANVDGFDQVLEVLGSKAKAKYQTPLTSLQTGYVHDIDAMKCGAATFELGAGRTQSDKAVDHSVGLVLDVDVGSRVNEGERLMTIYHNNEILDRTFLEELTSAIVINQKEPQKDDVTSDSEEDIIY